MIAPYVKILMGIITVILFTDGVLTYLITSEHQIGVYAIILFIFGLVFLGKHSAKSEASFMKNYLYDLLEVERNGSEPGKTA